jgi:hypothetical protein
LLVANFAALGSVAWRHLRYSQSAEARNVERSFTATLEQIQL